MKNLTNNGEALILYGRIKEWVIPWEVGEIYIFLDPVETQSYLDEWWQNPSLYVSSNIQKYWMKI